MASRQRYQTDYAKSGRSTCRGCSKKISQGDLRLAMLVQSAYRDGLDPHWHHFHCFFMKPRGLASSAILEGFGDLRPQDQECIDQKLEERGPDLTKKKSNAKTKGKGKNKRNIDVEDEKEDVKRYKKDSVPFSVQSDELWQIKDELSAHVNLAQLRSLLKTNHVYTKGGERTETLIPRVAKLIQFGVPPTCPDCSSEWPLRFCEDTGNWCCGAVLEYSNCPYIIAPKDLKTAPFVFPPPEKAPKSRMGQGGKKAVEEKPFVPSKFGQAIQRLALAFKKARIPVGKPDTGKSLQGQKLFSGFTFSHCRLQEAKKGELGDIKKLIEFHGGLWSPRVTSKVSFLIEDPDLFSRANPKIKTALKYGVSIVRETFIKHSIASNVLIDPTKYQIHVSRSSDDFHSEDEYDIEEYLEEKELIPKGARVAVHRHARKQLGKSARVLDLGGKSIFHAVLSKADIAQGYNTFYKMQVIQHGNKYYVAREHGRTGTTIGSHYLDTYHSASDAILAFQQLFAEKTGNDWDARGHFTKMPGRFEFVETRFLDSNKVAAAASDGQCQASSTHTTNTNLHSRVVDLVELIFNKKLMESAMLEMEIDLQKFPLGALTTTHVDKGYKTLSEISDVISGTTPSRDHTHRQQQLLTLSNKFFHIIPSVSIAVIDSEDKVAKKVELVDALRDMEVATRFLNDTENSTSTKSEAEEKYDLLRTKLEPLEVGGLDWKRLGQWVRNTKSLDNNRWGALKLVDAFAVSREGETNQFAKAGGKLHNHKLLWHGSRTTNYCGILSQGLRIAPPEAPCSGYRFGKGVYFADAVSKSANYCSTSGSSEMLIMACEVALGTEYEAYHDEYMERPRPGTHSTHAMGSIVPDPKADLHTVDGITIPTGKCKKNEIRSSCDANEFVVYNTNQVRIRYLLRLSVDAKKALPLRGPVLLASGRNITPPQGLVLSSD